MTTTTGKTAATHADYDEALRALGWMRLDEVPELHDAVAPSAAVVHHVKRARSERTFADVADAVEACKTATICAQCYVLTDLSHPVTAEDPESDQPPNHTGYWIVDLGPLPERVEPTVYRAHLALDPKLLAIDGGTATWTVLQASRNNEQPGESHMTLLAAMKIERTVYPWGCRRVKAKRFPKDKDGRWVYRAPGAVKIKADYHGVPMQAVPTVEVTTVQFGPEPPDDGTLLGEQPTLRTGNIKLDYIKALGEGRPAIMEIAEKASELAALARSALVDPKTATDLITALCDDRYDPPRPGKTPTQAVIMAICEEHGDALDLLGAINYE